MATSASQISKREVFVRLRELLGRLQRLVPSDEIGLSDTLEDRLGFPRNGRRGIATRINREFSEFEINVRGVQSRDAETVGDLLDLVWAAIQKSTAAVVSAAGLGAPAVLLGTNPLRRQAEEILDRHSDSKISVILQMNMGDSALQVRDLAGTTLDVMKRRSLLQSARDLRPMKNEERNRYRSGSAQVRRRMAKESLSFASQAVLATEAMTSVDKTGVDQRKAYFRSLVSKHAGIKQLRGKEKTKKKGAPVRKAKKKETFWLSGTTVLSVDRDELWNFTGDPSLTAGVDNICLNSVLRLPRVAEPKSLPQNVTDNMVSSWGVQAIGAMSVWGSFESRGEGIKVAVLDTGIDPMHPDLAGKLKNWAEFDGDGNRVTSTLADARETDAQSNHGTHVCGTVAGGNASGQWIGVAPGADLAAGAVLPGGSGTFAQILAGIEWAAEIGANVINMSLGGLTLDVEPPDIYTRTIISCLQLGIPVVTAIGNDGSQTTGTPGNDLFSYGVGATDSRDKAAGFSGGRTQVIRESEIFRPQDLPLVYSKPDISAPGVGIRSAAAGGGYRFLNGTSMATPHVSGAMALLMSAVPDLGGTPLERAFAVQDFLSSSVEELGESGQDHRYGQGRLDVLRAVGFAVE